MLCFVVCFTTHYRKAPPRPYMIFFALLSFLMSVVWIWWIANVLVDLLNVFGTMTNINQAYLGITVLAWGNSVGDMVANTAVAKKGLARMAITGCFAGPLFNLLLGLGLSLLLQNIKSGKQSFSWDSKENLTPMIVIVALILQLLFTAFMTWRNK